MLIRHAFAILNRILPAEEASAHCDIPCGIYDPHLAQVAALTVVRMNQLIEGLEAPGGGGGPPTKEDRVKFLNSLTRYIATKEEHAELVKHEVRIIRGDFFKPDHSPANIGALVDGIMTTASAARQHADKPAAEQKAVVKKIADNPHKNARAVVRQHDKDAVTASIEAEAPMPDGPFRVLLVDFPGAYGKRAGDGPQLGQTPDPTLAARGREVLRAADARA